MHVDGRYSVMEDGLRVLGVSASDEGDYTCRAEVEADGRYNERRIHVAVHGKFSTNVRIGISCRGPPEGNSRGIVALHLDTLTFTITNLQIKTYIAP